MRNRVVRVEGRVQGVGFRAYTLEKALSLGLGGSVRNLSDGAVEVEVRGQSEAVERLMGLLRAGPRFSEVRELVVVADEEIDGETGGFEIR